MSERRVENGLFRQLYIGYLDLLFVEINRLGKDELGEKHSENCKKNVSHKALFFSV